MVRGGCGGRHAAGLTAEPDVGEADHGDGEQAQDLERFPDRGQAGPAQQQDRAALQDGEEKRGDHVGHPPPPSRGDRDHADEGQGGQREADVVPGRRRERHRDHTASAAGAMKPCCQPSSVADASRCPSSVAPHPGFAFWCTST